MVARQAGPRANPWWCGALLPLCALVGCVDIVPSPETFASFDGGPSADVAGFDASSDDGVQTGDGAGADVTGQSDAAQTSDVSDDAATADAAMPDTDGDASSGSTDTADSDALGGDTAADAVPVDPCAGKKELDACDDGDPCTTTVCKGGKCVEDKQGNLCECKVAADCAAKDDGDPCTGTWYCDTSKPIRACKLNPVTVVTCADDGNVCTTTACDNKTGACVTQNVPDTDPKKTCDDGNKCTVSEVCDKGQCGPPHGVCASLPHHSGRVEAITINLERRDT